MMITLLIVIMLEIMNSDSIETLLSKICEIWYFYQKPVQNLTFSLRHNPTEPCFCTECFR